MIQNPILMGSQSNVQTRFLCASKDPTEIRPYLSSGLLQNLSAGPGDVEDPPSLELAIQRLEAIDFIGLTETLGADISMIAEDTSYHMPRHFPVINEDPFQNHDRLVLSEGELETLREHNSLDIQIYEFAKKLIERRSIRQRIQELVCKGIYSLPHGSFEIPISGILPGSGWQGLEQEGDSSWRSTGPTRFFTIEAPLRSDRFYILKMNFISPRSLLPGDLMVTVNDVAVETRLTSRGSDYKSEIVIIRDLLTQSNGVCSICFDSRVTIQAQAPDIRKLGLAVSRIVFECLEP